MSDLAQVMEREDFETQVEPLLGLEISQPWLGYGSALFLDLGRLVPTVHCRRRFESKASIQLNWDWRFERDSKILLGSADRHPFVEARIAELVGQTLVGVRLEGEIPTPAWATIHPSSRWLGPPATGSCRSS